jgi:hypothetical protein
MLESKSPISIAVPVKNGLWLPQLFGSLHRAGDARDISICLDGGYARNEPLVRSLCASLSYNASITRTLAPTGVSAARNAAARGATGEYICFLDADDEFAPAALSLAHRELADANWPEVLFGNSAEIDISSLITKLDLVVRPREISLPHDYWVLFLEGMAQLGAMYIKTKYFWKVGGFRSIPTWTDRDLQYRLLLGGGRIAFSPGVFVLWRTGHSGRLSEQAMRDLQTAKTKYKGTLQSWPTLARDPCFADYRQKTGKFLARMSASVMASKFVPPESPFSALNRPITLARVASDHGYDAAVEALYAGHLSILRNR